VVTRLRFKLYPVAQVYAGMSFDPAGRAAAVLAGYRDWAGAEPDELNSAVMVQQVPPLPEVPEPLRGARVLAVRAFHLGPAETAERLLRPVARLRPGASGGSFLNFLSDPARTETAYTAGNHRRLAGLKRVWGPDNFFHLNHNIPPG
jgi:hypothetical protein